MRIMPSLSEPNGCGLANPSHFWEMVYLVIYLTLVFIGLVMLLVPYAGIILALVWCFGMLLVVAKDAVRLVRWRHEYESGIGRVIRSRRKAK
jgi:hypothetical protein